MAISRVTYLSACALMYRQHGRRAVQGRGDQVVAAWPSASGKLGSGYLSAFPEEFIDAVERQSASGPPGTPCTRSWPACST